MSRNSVIIIGGGVIGTASAYYLAKRGWSVTLLERDQYGMGCSHGNCGLLAMSHVLPLTEPGAVAKTLKAMLTSHAPFFIKPRFDVRLWAWLYRFARRCNMRDMLEAARARHQLLQSSDRLYQQLLEEEAIECEWESQGCLFVYQSKTEMEKFAKTEELVRKQFGLAATRYDSDAVVRLEPALKPDVVGGWHYTTDAHLRPDRLMSSWRQVLQRLGVSILENCEVKGFVREDTCARAVDTSSGEMESDVFLLATGALTPLLEAHLGCRIPIQPGKGYSITMPRPAQCPRVPLIFPDHKVVVTPMKSGYRLGSTMEFSGYDSSLNRHRLHALKEAAEHYLHHPHCEPIEEEWYGWRPMTFDGKPIIDRCPAMKNVFLAAGHNMLGLSMAPATGTLIAELINGDSPHIDPAPYRVSRFRS